MKNKMKKYSLKNFTRGWIVGDFEPSALKSKDFEFMVHYYKKGEKEARHVHKVAHEITVIVSFRRDGTILGQPKITYESEQATDNDRLMYRIAVMQTLQRCTPMPFTAAMAGAVAGRPFAVKFHNRRPPPQPMEKRAWLLQKIL